MRSYESYSRGHTFPFPSIDSSFILFSVLWFFFFSFILFILTVQVYRFAEIFLKKNEYKCILFVAGIDIIAAFILIQLYSVVGDLIEFNTHSATAYVYESGIVITPDYNAHPFITPPIPPPFVEEGVFSAVRRPVFTEHLFVLVTIFLLVVLLRIIDSRQQIAIQFEKLKMENLQSSYNALMGQVNPHFFFNSLNGLNSLIRSGEQEKTLTYLDELSNVFRYVLQSNKKELVTLAEELEFVKAYTYLLSVRYEGKIFFSIQVDTFYLHWYLPILSILPLVENAVKHNVISKQYPLRIDIYTTKDDQLMISNQIRPKIDDNERSGIGLKNLWGRYRMLTSKDIHISQRKDYFKVSLPLLKKNAHS